MGFNAPSKIQETALPALLADPLVPAIDFVLTNEYCLILTSCIYCIYFYLHFFIFPLLIRLCMRVLKARWHRFWCISQLFNYTL